MSIDLKYDDEHGILSVHINRAIVCYFEHEETLKVLDANTGKVLKEYKGYVFALCTFIDEVKYFAKLCNP